MTNVDIEQIVMAFCMVILVGYMGAIVVDLLPKSRARKIGLWIGLILLILAPTFAVLKELATLFNNL